MDSNTLLILMAALFAVTMLIILLIVLNNAIKTNDLNNELSRSIYEIRSSLNRDFNDLGSSLNSQFSNFSERVNSNIIQSNKSSNEVFNSINEKMVRILATQDNLDELSKGIISLEDILTDKKSRGTFGEIELFRICLGLFALEADIFCFSLCKTVLRLLYGGTSS